ncbi:MAG: hypothetical protein IT450_22590 [Phycisphaerales bacterium]|nr:hypothetical protein [Phycisphaerales bacterium]
MSLKPQFVVDADGNRRAVILTIEEYQSILDALEDRLDAQDFAEALRSAEPDDQFTPYEQVRDDLRREGRL